MKTKYHPVFRHLLVPAGGGGANEIELKTTMSRLGDLEGDRPPPVKTMKEVFKIVLIPVMCGWTSCVITFSVYPTQAGIWTPYMSDPPFSAEVYQSFLMYSFSIADTIGRAVPRWVPRLKDVTDKQFITGTLVRGSIFIPLFLLSTHHVWFVFSSDVFRLILVLFFGLSNGINFNLSNMLAPRLVEAEDKMNVGTILSFAAINGLFVGSLIAIGLVQI